MITEIQESDLIRKYGGMKNKVLEWIEDTDKKRVGTVHTFQGKEADEVIVLLGCDKNSKGAVRWVNSNIVNVAATVQNTGCILLVIKMCGHLQK